MRDNYLLTTMDKNRLHSHPQNLDPTKRWVIGAAIFQNIKSQNPSLLLLKRTSHEDAFPNAWELPGGHVEEETDESVAHAVAREVLEETQLVVTDIVGEIEEMTWESKARSRSNVQLNYVVTVQEGDVKLNPDEHSDWQWVQEGQVEDFHMTVEMRKVLKDAFHFMAQASLNGYSSCK